MLHLFHTEVDVLYVSNESMHYVKVCFIQKLLSCMFPSSQWTKLHLFYTEVGVLCGSFE